MPSTRIASRLLTGALAAVAALVIVSAAATAGPFSLDTILVERVSGTATNVSQAIGIYEYTTSGSLVQTITFPSSGADQQTDIGSSISNGYLNTYAGYVSVPGLNLPASTASATGSNAKVNSTLDTSGTVVSRVLFPTGGRAGTPPSPFSDTNYRSSIATSGSTFYATGAGSGSPNTGGAWYYDGSAFVQVSSTAAGQPVNSYRNVEIYNDQLYFSSSTGTFLGISSVGTGLPTTSGQTAVLQISTGASSSPYGFVMFATGSQGSALDLAYIADERSTAGGGLQKWTFNGSTWSRSWSLLVGASGTSVLQSGTGAGFAGLRGLAGTWDAVTGASLFAVTTETNNNRLISILDTGSQPTTYTQLASAGAGTVFRGVDLSPVTAVVPEPSSIALAVAGGALAAAAHGRRRRQARDHVLRVRRA